MLAHDTGVSRSANHRHLIHLTYRPVITGLLLSIIGMAGLARIPLQIEAQPIPARTPGPRLQVEPPEEPGPREVEGRSPDWVLERAKASAAGLEKALEAARNPAACLRLIRDSESPLARRLAFACHVLLGHRVQADSLFYELSWNDGGRTASRLAAWRGIEEDDPYLVERSLSLLANPTLGDWAGLAWAKWKQGESLEGVLPSGWDPGVAGRFLELARAVQTGDTSNLGAPGMPAEWVELETRIQNPSRARDVLVSAYEASRGEDWSATLAQSNRLLALYPQSPWRGQAYLLRCLGRLSEGSLELARVDLESAKRFLDPSMPVQIGLLEVFLSLQGGNSAEADRRLLELRHAPVARGEEPALLFHAARLARFRGDEAAVADALLVLEEAYGTSPWYARALNDDDSEQWGLPVIDMQMPPAQAQSRVTPPNEGPFGRMLWGDGFLGKTVEAIENVRAEQPAPQEREVMMQARPETPNGARVLAGGGSRDTRYLEWDWIREADAEMDFRLTGSLTKTQEGSALPESRRTNLGVSLRRERDNGSTRLDVNWDGRTEGDHDVQARGGTLALTFESMDGGETGGIRQASLRASVGNLSARDSQWEYAWFETQGSGSHPTLFGDLESRWSADFGLQRQEGDRITPWMLGGTLYLPLGASNRVGVGMAASRTEFLLLPVASFHIDLPAGFGFWGNWEPRMDYPEYHAVFMRGGDWNVPDFELGPVVRPVHVSSGLSWQSSSTTVEASGTHYQADHFRSFLKAGDLWQETALDGVRGNEVSIRARHLGFGGSVLALVLQNVRVEQNGRRVPFTPSWTGRVEFGHPWKRWYYGGVAEAVAGRRDFEGRPFGSYVGLNLEVTYKTPIGLQASARIVNLTNSPVRRWPDRPIFSRGVFAGLGYRFGS